MATLVANLGSGGVDYGVLSYTHLHLDLAPQQLRNVRFRIVGDVEHLPLRSASVDLVLCVGEVLNFSSPDRVIEEIARVARPRGLVVLEFESNRSLEFIGSRFARKDATEIKTFYNAREVSLQVFDPEFIALLVRNAGLAALRTSGFHILSALVYRITGLANASAIFAGLDLLLSRLPFFRTRACNVIVGAKRLD